MAINDIMSALINELEKLIPEVILSDSPFTTKHWGDNVQSLLKLKELFSYINDNNVAPPVGFVYTQYPRQAEPTDLWGGGEWTDITSDYAGSFFRAEGGLSTAFNAGTQADSAPNIVGYVDAMHSYGLSSNGAIRHSDMGMVKLQGTGNGSRASITIDASRSSASYGRRAEVAPVNQSIKLWKRTK